MIPVRCNAPIAFAGSGLFLHPNCDSSAAENFSLVCVDASWLSPTSTGFCATNDAPRIGTNNATQQQVSL